MAEADVYRQLADALDDIAMWRSVMALLPWTVHVDHDLERATERATLLLSRIPPQRRPIDLRPRAAPAGAPARPNTQWGRRSNR